MKQIHGAIQALREQHKILAAILHFVEEIKKRKKIQIFVNGCGSHFVFNGFIPKDNQIIRNT